MSGGDFQKGSYLYKLTSGTPEHLWMFDRPQKQASEKADQSTCGSGVMIIDRGIDW